MCSLRLMAGDETVFLALQSFELFLSDTVIVGVLSSADSSPLHHKEGDGAQEAHQHHDEQLPLQEKVVAVEEGHRCCDGLQRHQEQTQLHILGYPINRSEVNKCGFLMTGSYTNIQYISKQ